MNCYRFVDIDTIADRYNHSIYLDKKIDISNNVKYNNRNVEISLDETLDG